MKKVIIFILTAIIAIGVIGCSNEAGKNEQIGIRGQITDIQLDGNKSVTGILVEGKLESDTQHDKAYVKLDKKTKIFKGNTNDKLSAEELKKEMKVEIVFEGPVAESYPVQAKAKTIRVLE